MQLKNILYGNSVGKIRILLQEMKQGKGKIKFKRKVYKFKLPDIEYSLLPVKDMIKILELEPL